VENSIQVCWKKRTLVETGEHVGKWGIEKGKEHFFKETFSLF